MKFVVDTNVLFTFFWEDSFTKGLLVDQDIEYFAPEFALEEINKHSIEIMEKTGVSIDKFKELRADLGIFIEFIPLQEYMKFLKEALKLIPSSPDDIDFLALALKLQLPIWSNDAHLKQQSKVKVHSTSEFLRAINPKV